MRSFVGRARLAVASKWYLALAVFAGAMSFADAAGATATYDLTPVTTSITSELAANVPTILGIVGGILALGIGMKLVKRFTHA